MPYDFTKFQGKTVEADQRDITELADIVARHTTDSIDEATGGLKARIKELEQHMAGGMTSAPSVGGMSGGGGFADRITRSEQFKQFAAGNARHAKCALDGPLFERKSTTTGSYDTVQPQRVAGIVGGAFQELRIRDLFPVMQTSSNLIEYTREGSFTNAAAPTAEAGTKPESDVVFELGEAQVATIAHWLRLSRQVMDDNPALAAYLNDRLRYGVLLAEEAQFINGDGTGTNISGILQAVNHTEFNRGATGDDRIQTLRKAATQLQLADWRASGIIVNPADWEVIELQKDNEERYLWADPQNAAQPVMWGVPVVPSNTMPEGEFVVADFRNAGMIFDRQQAVVEMFEQDHQNVTENLVTIRAEERVALAITRPAAIVAGAFE